MGSVSIPEETKQAIVYMREVRWDVVIPLHYEWEFMQAFGERFRYEDAMEGGSYIRQVDSYRSSNGGDWHIKVSVHESEEIRLLNFCREFFVARGMTFREPESIIHPAVATFIKIYHKEILVEMKSGEKLKGVVVGHVGPTWVSLYIPGRGNVQTEYDDIAEANLVNESQPTITHKSATQPMTCWCPECRKEVPVSYHGNQLICGQRHIFDVPGDW